MSCATSGGLYGPRSLVAATAARRTARIAAARGVGRRHGADDGRGDIGGSVRGGATAGLRLRRFATHADHILALSFEGCANTGCVGLTQHLYYERYY